MERRRGRASGTSLGRHADAQEHCDALERRALQGAVDPLSLALAHLGRGHHERALDLLELACRARAPGLYQLAVDPVYRPLRGDPRFGTILRTMGLERVVPAT